MSLYDELAHKNGVDIIAQVKELKQQLADTDYLAIKFSEGWITAEEYAPIKAQREAIREQIRALEN